MDPWLWSTLFAAGIVAMLLGLEVARSGGE